MCGAVRCAFAIGEEKPVKHARVQAIGERWARYQPSKAHAFWFASGCVALTLIAGFSFGGWETRATVQEQLTHAGTSARRQLASALCVEDFLQAQNAGAGLQRVKDAAWHERDDIVAEGGWATLPGSNLPNYAVAEMCSAKLAQLDASEIASLTQSAEMRTTR
jgi:hypothetical protein